MQRASFFQRLALSAAVSLFFFAACAPPMPKDAEGSPSSSGDSAPNLKALTQGFERSSADLAAQTEDIITETNEGKYARALLEAAALVEQESSADELRRIHEEATALAPEKAQNALFKPNSMPSAADWAAASAEERQAFAAQFRHSLIAAAYASAAASQASEIAAPYTNLPLLVQNIQQVAIVGEPYEFRVMLGKISTENKFSLQVNGMMLPSNNENAPIYKSKPSAFGKQKYTATANISNPLTGEMIRCQNEFSYFISPAKMAIAQLPKQEVFYIGIDNPIYVAFPGISSADVGISASGCGVKLSRTGVDPNFVCQVASEGEVTITIEDKKRGKIILQKTIRARALPDPIAFLPTAKSSSGTLAPADFKKELGLMTRFEDPRFQDKARCEISNFVLMYQPKGKPLRSMSGAGGRFEGAVLAAVQSAAAGDWFHFVDIKARCPGDKAGRLISPMSFQIR